MHSDTQLFRSVCNNFRTPSDSAGSIGKSRLQRRRSWRGQGHCQPGSRLSRTLRCTSRLLGSDHQRLASPSPGCVRFGVSPGVIETPGGYRDYRRVVFSLACISWRTLALYTLHHPSAARGGAGGVPYGALVGPCPARFMIIAIQRIQADSLFWLREVFYKAPAHQPATPPT